MIARRAGGSFVLRERVDEVSEMNGGRISKRVDNIAGQNRRTIQTHARRIRTPTVVPSRRARSPPLKGWAETSAQRAGTGAGQNPACRNALSPPCESS